MQKVVIDTDLGVDDAWAVMLALASDDLDILGFTTVFGNVESTQAAENMLHVLGLVGRDIPIFLGAKGPIIPTLDPKTGAPQSPSFPGKEVHGLKGLGSYNLPKASQIPAGNAVLWLAETVRQSKGDIDIVALGPLTNIALASLIEPDFVKKVRRLIFMGGVTNGPGNVLPLSTANIWNDPEAALIVFHADFKEIVMVGQDVTRCARITEKEKDRLTQMNTKVSCFLLAISDTYASEYAKSEPKPPGYPLHDLLAISYLIEKNVFTTDKLYVTVETHGRSTRGQTVADRRQNSPYTPQMNVCVEVNLERVFQTFFSRIEEMRRREENPELVHS